MPIDEVLFRTTMGHFASGVTVVTCRSGEELFGMTVASFASLSLRPPLILVCIETSVRTHDAIISAGEFGVNILHESQEEASRRFASKSSNRFEGVALRSGQGIPLLEGALASIACRLLDHFPGGDHSIFVGEVTEAFHGEGNPLLYFRSGYRELK